MSEKIAFTRRDFLKGTAAGAAGVALTSPGALYAGQTTAQERSRAVLIPLSLSKPQQYVRFLQQICCE